MLKACHVGLILVPVLLASCGRAKNGQSEVQEAGETVGSTVMDFASGVGKGIDKQAEVTVELSDDFEQLGLSKTVAKRQGINGPREPRSISVYILAQRPVAGSMVAKAFNDRGQEIGRASVPVEFQEDDAHYVTFKFDSELDLQLVERYRLEFRPGRPAEAERTPEENRPANGKQATP